MAYLSQIKSFGSIEKDWRALLPASRANPIFSSYKWQRAWWEVFGKGKELLLISIRDSNEVIGIAPLMREDAVISLLGGTDISDYHDFIIAKGHEQEFYSTLLDNLQQQNWRTMDMHHLPVGSPTLTSFTQIVRERGYSVEVSQEDVCPQLELPNTWDEYLALLSKKDRHELRRKIRRLSNVDSVRYYDIDPSKLTPQDIDDFFGLFKKSRQDKAQFMTSQMVSFFQNVLELLNHQDKLRLYFLELNGQRVATSLCFDYEDELALYNSGYDPAYAALSVGLLMKAFCVRDAIERGKKRFDFLRGDEPYKYDLGGRDDPIFRCVVKRQ